MIRTVVALAEQGAYREDWGGVRRFSPSTTSIAEPTSESSTESHNQPDPPKPKKFPLDRMRLSLRDPLVIGPPLLAKKERKKEGGTSKRKNQSRAGSKSLDSKQARRNPSKALRQGLSRMSLRCALRQPLMSTSNAHEPELSPGNPFPSKEVLTIGSIVPQ